jgi:hypothetical protein
LLVGQIAQIENATAQFNVRDGFDVEGEDVHVDLATGPAK